VGSPPSTPARGGFVDLLDPADRAALLGLGLRRRYPSRAALIIQGDPGDTVFVVLSGRTKVTLGSPGGDEIVLAVDGPGDLLGLFEAIDPDGGPRTAANVAIEPTECRAIPGEEFRRFIDDHPRVAPVILRWVIRRLRAADWRRLDAFSCDAVHRLARLLVEVAGEPDDPDTTVDVDIPLTQAELARLIATSRDSLVRALTSLRSRGLVATARRRITILDLGGLRRYATGESAALR
jgi:CRP-like cAMP-binding protein